MRGRFLLGIAVLSSVAFLSSPSLTAAQSAAEIQLPDEMVAPGATVTIRARLVRSGIFSAGPVSGERLEFFADGKALGQSLTGGDGWAVRSHTVARPGLTSIKVRLAPNPRVTSEDADGFLIVAAKGRTLALIDIDAVAKSRKKTGQLPLPSGEPTPEPGAALAVTEWSRSMDVVFVALGDTARVMRARSWLAQFGFPPRPVLRWLTLGPSFPAERAQAEIARIRDAGWTGPIRLIAGSESLVGGFDPAPPGVEAAICCVPEKPGKSSPKRLSSLEDGARFLGLAGSDRKK